MIKTSILYSTVLLVAVFTVISAKEGCTLGNGVTLAAGEKYYESKDHCEEITCEGDGVTSSVLCPTMTPNPEYECEYIPEDLSKPYPACCETYKCGKKREPVIVTLGA